MIPCRVEAIHDDGVRRRWEIKYLAAPYSHWTVEEHREEEAALEARLAEVLDGGFAVPSAREMLKNCLGEEACDVEAEVEKQTQLGQIVHK